MNHKKEYDFEMERILDDRQWVQLEALVQDDLRSIYGNAHDRWIARARRQVKHGEKLAYGVWKRDLYRTTEPEMVAVCIFHNALSGMQQEDTLEIKLVYVKKGYRNPLNGGDSRDERLHLGRRLLEKVIEVGQRHEYEAVVADAKTDVESVAFFFLKNGFHITSLHYQFSWPSYQFGCRIRPVYRQDPNDARMVVEWLCHLWGLKAEPTEDNRIMKASYPLHSHVRFFPEKTYEAGPTLPLHIAIVENEKETVLDTVATPRLVFLRNDAAKPLDKEGTAYLALSDVRRLTENRAIKFLPVGTKLDFAVAVRQDFFARFKLGKRGIFLDGGCYGNLLNGISDARVFFFDTSSSRNNARMLGYAGVETVVMGHPHTLWHDYHDLSAFDEERFAQYANIKTKMTGIIFGNLVKVVVDHTTTSLPDGGWSYLTASEGYELFSKASRVLQNLK